MSLKRLVLVSNASHMHGKDDEEYTTVRPHAVPVQGVNVLLGGAMMSGIIIMVFLICYCCHRNQHHRQTTLPRYWREQDMSMEVYTIEGQQLFEIPEDMPRTINSGPPPSYEAVVLGYEDKETSLVEIIRNPDDAELPSYEAAMQMALSEGRLV